MKRDADEARDDAAVSSDEISNSEKDMKAEEPEGTAEPEGDAEKDEPGESEKDASGEPDAEPEESEADASGEPDAEPEEPTAKADAPASRTAQERSRHSGVMFATLALTILALVGLLLPAWGIPLGCDLGGASVVTLTASDYEDGTTAADALAVLKNRAALLSERDIQVTQTGDDTFELRVPAGYDASSVASALTRKGHLEFARLDSVSDADALQQLQAGASGVTLDEGTYEPFLTSDEVKDATVVSQSYYGMTYYALSVSLDSDGASALASTTEDLAASSGQIAVLLDGAVIAEPSVKNKIEGSKISISGGYTEDQATAYAAALSGGELPCSLSQTEPVSVAARARGHARELAAVAAIALAIVAGAVASAKFGRAGFLAAKLSVVVVAITLGVLTILYRFELVILGRAELLGLATTEVISIICGARMAARYRAARNEGSSVRKSQQQATGPELALLVKAAVAVLVLSVATAFFAHGFARELAVTLAAGMASLLVALGLFAPAALCVRTAADVFETADDEFAAAQDGAAGVTDGE